MIPLYIGEQNGFRRSEGVGTTLNEVECFLQALGPQWLDPQTAFSVYSIVAIIFVLYIGFDCILHHKECLVFRKYRLWEAKTVFEQA